MRPADRALPNWNTATLLAGLDFSAYSDRAVTPAQTVERMWPYLEKLGISRVARQTSLDQVGIPCWAAFRPNSRTLAGSQGKGLSDAAACASAIMEAAESAVAERPAGFSFVSSAEELDRKDQLWFNPERLMATSFDRRQAIQWIRGRDLVTGDHVWVPQSCIDMDGEASDIRGICKTSNGLASGNTTQEAVFHGLCELIERDGTTLASLAPIDEALDTCFDPADLHDPAVDALVQVIRRAGFEITMFDQTSDLGVPVVMALLSPLGEPLNFLEIGGGWGCHPIPARAAIRAITEAAQARVTAIAGSRDDIALEDYESEAAEQLVMQARAVPRKAPPAGLALGTPPAVLLRHLLRAVTRRRCSVVALDISHPDMPFAVAKVLSADLEDRDANAHWRPGRRANLALEAL